MSDHVEVRATNTHLFRGARLLIDTDRLPLAPCEITVIFSDGVPVEASLRGTPGHLVLHAPAHRTFAGRGIAAKSWSIARIEAMDGTTSAIVIGPRV